MYFRDTAHNVTMGIADDGYGNALKIEAYLLCIATVSYMYHAVSASLLISSDSHHEKWSTTKVLRYTPIRCDTLRATANVEINTDTY